jgi:hypothetical protein
MWPGRPSPGPSFLPNVMVNESPLADYDFYTLYVGTLVLQVLRPDPPPSIYGTLERMRVPSEIELPFMTQGSSSRRLVRAVGRRRRSLIGLGWST